MAINPTVALANAGMVFVSPLEAIADWVGVGDGGSYLNMADADPITDPEMEITESSRQIFSRGNRPATRLWLRMRYEDGFTTTQSPGVRVFGRVSLGATPGTWQALRSLSGNLRITLATSALDTFKSDDRFTIIDLSDHAVDTQGCNEFLVGVELEWQVSAGTPSLAGLEVRFT